MSGKVPVMVLLIVLCVAVILTADNLEAVTGYVRIAAMAETVPGHAPQIIIRQFKRGGLWYGLTVDAESLTTDIRRLPHRVDDEGWRAIELAASGTRFISLLCSTFWHADMLQDAGITHFGPSEKGIDLTVDLCPARHPLDRAFFSVLQASVHAEEPAIPIGISITGAWIREHPDDFSWLAALGNSKQLSITWINHSNHHHVIPGVPLQHNFMLQPGTNLDDEILGVEKLLIEHGQVPSVFFRFPGLVSNDSLVHTVLSYGLVPLGSDAWLAKNQHVRNGSIVLVHANGNDPVGVEDFYTLLKSKSREIANHEWYLYDLRESVKNGVTSDE